MPETSRDLQLTADGELRHFLAIEGLDEPLLTRILDTADSFIEVGERTIKKVPLLRGRTVVNLFFEPSTRTRSTFELAAKRLSADVLNLDIGTSATSKGESLSDTLLNLRAMASDMFVMRHSQSGAPHFVAQSVTPDVALINAGDGRHEHPTQAMLDVLTIRQHMKAFSGLRVAIVGDVQHSRVARSQIRALNALGVDEVRLIAPDTLLPHEPEALGARVFHRMEEGLRNVDVIIMLRLQHERMEGALLPSESEFYRMYGLSREKLAYANPGALVMHPGPINRGVEIESAVADGPQSVILGQVTNGIAVRMAVMSMAMGGQLNERQSGTSAGVASS